MKDIDFKIILDQVELLHNNVKQHRYPDIVNTYDFQRNYFDILKNRLYDVITEWLITLNKYNIFKNKEEDIARQLVKLLDDNLGIINNLFENLKNDAKR